MNGKQCCLTPVAVFFFLLLSNLSSAAPTATARTAEFSNEKVSVWQTVIAPDSKQVLTMHRHEHDRVLVALSDGLLKITNDKGKVHYLTLQKNKAYFLTKDVPNELHQDQNMSSHPIKVMVIELKN